jgi:putative N6-adenine-specific DNA methylase
MVFFDADAAGMARAHLWLRTAERVLLVAGRFSSPDFDRLFEGIRAIPWEDYSRPDSKIVFEKIRLNSSKLTSVPAVQSVAQKALYERLTVRFRQGRMPETGETLSLRLYVERDEAMVGIDLSGEALHRRGYRKVSGPAPLKETIAAAVILAAGWKRRFALYDPFCGTGTIPIEAGLYAFNVPPGLGRGFAFRSMPFCPDEVFRAEREKAAELIDFGRDTRISGSDGDMSMVEAAAKNALAVGNVLGGARKAGASDFARSVGFRQLSMEEAKADCEEGFIITNPPYGERLRDKDYAENLYRQMRHFKKDFRGWSLVAITTHPDFPALFGAAPESVKEIQNGQERTFIYRFEGLAE